MSPAIAPQSLPETEDFVKVLYYGDSKKGKTTAMAGAARLGEIVAVDIEGMGWLKKPLRDQGIPVENIIKFTPTSYEEMEQVYYEIQGMFDDGRDIKAVCVDHLTDLEARLIRAATIKRQAKTVRELELLAVTSKEARNKLDDINQFKSELQDYGVWTNQARHLMRLYRDLPCHVAFGAHYRTDVGKKVPALTEKFRIDLMGSLAMILACTTLEVGDENFYVAYAREKDGWVGGDRFNVTRPIIVNPSLDRLVMAANAKLDFLQDPEQKAFRDALSKG